MKIHVKEKGIRTDLCLLNIQLLFIAIIKSYTQTDKSEQ